MSVAIGQFSPQKNLETLQRVTEVNTSNDFALDVFKAEGLMVGPHIPPALFNLDQPLQDSDVNCLKKSLKKLQESARLEAIVSQVQEAFSRKEHTSSIVLIRLITAGGDYPFHEELYTVAMKHNYPSAIQCMIESGFVYTTLELQRKLFRWAGEMGHFGLQIQLLCLKHDHLASHGVIQSTDLIELSKRGLPIMLRSFKRCIAEKGQDPWELADGGVNALLFAVRSGWQGAIQAILDSSPVRVGDAFIQNHIQLPYMLALATKKQYAVDLIENFAKKQNIQLQQMSHFDEPVIMQLFCPHKPKSVIDAPKISVAEARVRFIEHIASTNDWNTLDTIFQSKDLSVREKMEFLEARNKDGRSLLELACMYKSVQVALVSIDFYGFNNKRLPFKEFLYLVNVFVQNELIVCFMRSLFVFPYFQLQEELPALLKAVNHEGNTLLNSACMTGNLSLACMLVELGARPSEKDLELARNARAMVLVNYLSLVRYRDRRVDQSLILEENIYFTEMKLAREFALIPFFNECMKALNKMSPLEASFYVNLHDFIDRSGSRRQGFEARVARAVLERVEELTGLESLTSETVSHMEKVKIPEGPVAIPSYSVRFEAIRDDEMVQRVSVSSVSASRDLNFMFEEDLDPLHARGIQRLIESGLVSHYFKISPDGHCLFRSIAAGYLQVLDIQDSVEPFMDHLENTIRKIDEYNEINGYVPLKEGDDADGLKNNFVILKKIIAHIQKSKKENHISWLDYMQESSKGADFLFSFMRRLAVACIRISPELKGCIDLGKMSELDYFKKVCFGTEFGDQTEIAALSHALGITMRVFHVENLGKEMPFERAATVYENTELTRHAIELIYKRAPQLHYELVCRPESVGLW